MKSRAYYFIFALLCISVNLISQTPQTLPFSQNWTNTGLITINDNWSGVPGIIGYRGDDLTLVTGTDPQTILAPGTSTPVNVIANQTNPNITNGGAAGVYYYKFETGNYTEVRKMIRVD
jgi:hypothetical protein